jgi:rhamnogalacturonan endolyase
MAFGVTETPTTYVVDNGGDLKFTVLRGGTVTSTVHRGDVTSIRYKNVEMLAPFAQTSRYSHYEQGLGATTAVSYVVDNAAGWIKLTCDDSGSGPGGVIQYYAVRRNDNNIYMASLPNDVNGGPGEGRFIAYLSKSVFTNVEQPSNIAGNDGAVEGSDVFHFPNGTTASKFYNMGRRMIENTYHGVTGGSGGVGAWMFMGNRETSSGGPFFKDIDFQTTDAAVEIYNCLFTGHTQTEAYRQGLKGPYVLQFTNGSAPPVQPDYSWMGALNLSGWVPASGRGTLLGKASGVPGGHEVTVGLANANAQYWGTPDAAGNYAIGGVRAGTYTETLYDNELAVGARTVTINAGAITRADIVSTYYRPTPIWRIGTWDGSPLGLLNSDKIEVMHPSDSRIGTWSLPMVGGTPTFTVGTNTDGQWPMAQFKDMNNNPRIVFTLTAAQVQALTLRVGLTLAFASGRPNITVNVGKTYAWTSPFQSPSAQPDSRGITRGTWRGNNVVHSFNIPASALRAGVNTIDVFVISGETSTGFLSPSITYDAIDLVPTSSLTNAPRLTSIAVSTANSIVGINGTNAFTAVARDQFGNMIPANVTWSAARGTIDDTGMYKAPATAGADTITATSGAVAGSTSVSVVAGAPDANLDGKVGFEDLVVLAQNYNTAGKTFAEGDFNYDTKVDFEDLVLLAQWYNTALPGAAPATPVEFDSPKSSFSAAPVIKPTPLVRAQTRRAHLS